ncbi:esterase family protein [Corynebacterium poyangense]|uniref:Esterase family protein n=1 Tax=Corynebacterium poyangense TaxID=2684405 RepID=A0A7H0SNF0_9CORY|nr:alpha/beta hydrolase-fold protein [Corynebacterium poyangense]MBZ8177103.1 esterase family protein [Corynebacterium poyangense]QNQ90075.1 esterase family protein [Corynebacterium poyangense]
MDRIGLISLTDHKAAFAIALLVGIPLVTLFVIGLKKERRMVFLGVIVAALCGAVAVWAFIEKVWHPFPDSIPVQVYAGGAVALAMYLGALVFKRRRILCFFLAICATGGAWGIANLHYQEYPTARSLDPQPISRRMDFATFQKLVAAPTLDGRQVGALVQVPLAGYPAQDGGSGYPARNAFAYIPPAYWTHPAINLPVVVLLAGNPGEPEQWFTTAEGEATVDEFQANHDGISPIVISVDGTGSWTGNPICVDGPDLKVQSYLARDVPRLIKERFRVNPDTKTWTIGGFSYGGTCSLQVVTNAPDVYGSFLDFSGQAEPTLGDHKQTVDTFFGSNEQAYQAVNPETLLRNAEAKKSYSGIAGKFIAGEDDHESVAALQHLNDLAGKAGMVTEFQTLPGAHSFRVWRVALRETLGWAAQRGGLSA